MKPEIIDNVNKPSHYQGANGLEAIDVVHNFVGDLSGASAFFWTTQSSICYGFKRKTVLKT